MSASLAVLRSIGHEHVLLESRQLRVVDVLADLAMELCQRLVGAVLLKFVDHPRPGVRNQQNLLARGRIQVEVHEQTAVDGRALLLRERLAEQGVELGDRRERPAREDALDERRRQLRDGGELLLGGDIGVHDRDGLADLCRRRRGRDRKAMLPQRGQPR